MREKFKWMITDYNLYAAFNVICQVFGNIFGTYVLNKMFGIPEILMAIIGYFSAMAEYIIAGLASYSWQFYVGKIKFMQNNRIEAIVLIYQYKYVSFQLRWL